MNYLIYTEVPLYGDHVEFRLAALDPSATVKVMVPVRRLTAEELQFLELEMAPEPAESPEGLFARWRLRDAVACLHRAGFENVGGETVVGSPLDAIEAAVEADRPGAVVVITDPAGVAGWVHMDLAHRVQRHIDEPLIHIELEPAYGA
jgi:hypothetical protein